MNWFCTLSLVLLAILSFGADAASQPAPKPAAKPPVNVPPHNRIPLWPAGKSPSIAPGEDSYSDPTEPTLDCWQPADPPSGAAILILPGGGYTHLAGSYEGADLAEILAQQHIAAFVLRYRHAPRYAYPVPMLDAERAMRTLRTKAADFHFDPHKLGILGFSAGGHLAATLSTQADHLPKPDSLDDIDTQTARPDFALLIYPVITLSEPGLTHTGSRKALVADDAALALKLSAEKNVTPNTPPTFLVHAAPDTTVSVENSILYFQALRKNKVPAELHIFAVGKHGFGIAAKDPVLSTWPDMAVRWMLEEKIITK